MLPSQTCATVPYLLFFSLTQFLLHVHSLTRTVAFVPKNFYFLMKNSRFLKTVSFNTMLTPITNQSFFPEIQAADSPAEKCQHFVNCTQTFELFPERFGSTDPEGPSDRALLVTQMMANLTTIEFWCSWVHSESTHFFFLHKLSGIVTLWGLRCLEVSRLDQSTITHTDTPTYTPTHTHTDTPTTHPPTHTHTQYVG